MNKVPCDKDLPAEVNLALLATAPPEPELLHRYQSICGALLYASTNTRPDVAFATGMLCRAMGRPTPELHEAALRVLGYLYRTCHIGLRYEASTASLEGYSDSDWAVKHSTSGHAFHLGSATISWASKKQPSVALSSCEAEIVAVWQDPKRPRKRFTFRLSFENSGSTCPNLLLSSWTTNQLLISRTTPSIMLRRSTLIDVTI